MNQLRRGRVKGWRMGINEWIKLVCLLVSNAAEKRNERHPSVEKLANESRKEARVCQDIRRKLGTMDEGEGEEGARLA